MPSYIPDGYSSVTPWIVGSDTAGLIDYLKRAFGAQELARLGGSDGRIEHAEMRLCGAVVMAFDAPLGWPPTPAFLRLFVEDCDATFARAVRAGGTMVSGCKRLAFGDCVGRVRDPFGNIWWLQTHIEDVPADELAARDRDPEYTAAMAYMRETLVDGLK